MQEQVLQIRIPGGIAPLPAFVRYLLAGLGAFAVDFSAFAALTHGASVDPLVSHVISRPLGGVTCYLLNRRFTFGSKAAVVPEFLRFACVFLASLALTEGLLALFLTVAGLPALVGKALAEGIAVAFNFLALRRFAYRVGSAALLLVLLASASLPSGAAPPAFEAVTPGVEYQRVVADGVISHVVKVDLKSPGLRLRSIKAKGKETVHELALRMDEGDTRVWAAINGDYYRPKTSAGLPFGVHVQDGRVLFAPMKRSAIGFGPDNEPTVEIVRMKARLTFASKGNREGARWTEIDDINVLESEITGRDGVYLFTPSFLGLKLGRAKGLIAVVESIAPNLQVGDVCEGKIVRVESADADVDVPETGCLLFFNGTSARQLAASIKPGHPVALKIDLPPITGDVVQAIGGGPRIVRDGRAATELKNEDFDPVYAAEISKRHPRSAVGYDRAKKALFLVMVEGRHDDSRGMTFKELGEFLVRVGCHNGMAFDGGGSAGLYVGGKGMVSASMGKFNRPEDREVANALLVTTVKAPAAATSGGGAPVPPAK